MPNHETPIMNAQLVPLSWIEQYFEVIMVELAVTRRAIYVQTLFQADTSQEAQDYLFDLLKKDWDMTEEGIERLGQRAKERLARAQEAAESEESNG